MSSYNIQLQSNNISLQEMILKLQTKAASGDRLVDNSKNENAIINRTISGAYINSRITNLRPYAFASCINLTSISLPSVTTVGVSVFRACVNLSTADLSAAETIGNSAFYSCRNLSNICLGASTVCTLEYSKAFSSTPFTGYSVSFSGTPHIYVPASLINAYQSATNWTYFSSYFSSIESLEKELITFTIDGAQYQAVEGMTWGEWVNSEYNTLGCHIDEDGYVKLNYSAIVSNPDYPYEFIATDIITPDFNYKFSNWG